MKVHLGCGNKYLEGYVNIDLPPSEHTVMEVKADMFADIRTLEFPENSIEEVRLHHLFEHFTRAEALKLLVRWRKWLKVGGILHIQTPDFAACALKYLYAPIRLRLKLGRHIFGSQEARWANHLDFWDKKKFKFVLKKLGYDIVKIKRYCNSFHKHYSKIPFSALIGELIPEKIYQKYGGYKLPDIVVFARKNEREINYDEVVEEILETYLIGKEDRKMLEVWMNEYRNM
ncbi:MAG: hypothetical protein CH6_2177 [Candidatus Kapaibacterium sp.]|nr:MAG: hypothetical protein CH6_2177 [Candidatus Kapabacteria bacterium]